MFDAPRQSFWILGILAACSSAPPPAGHSTPNPPTPGSPARAPDRSFELPVVMQDHRWFLQTTTTTGAPIRIYLDSAGGLYLTNAAASRLQLERKPVEVDSHRADGVVFPALADRRIPPARIDVVPLLKGEFDEDGMFGAPWFSPHTFTFDYPRQKMILRTPGDLPRVAPEHRVTVAFRNDTDGVGAYGRIQMIVDSQSIDMLFDTGATVRLTDVGIQALGGTAKMRATSFITDAVFQRWRKAHPTWRVIEDASHEGDLLHVPMIEVPTLTVGGYDVGPVWFTWRPDSAFHSFMAQYMDKPAEGALGGSAFYDLRISVDWAAGAATFER